MTGQPNAMGGRETGALATMLAGHLRFDVAEEHAALAAFWSAPSLPRAPGLKATQLFAALGEGRIGALWVMATNPAVSLPDGDAVRGALARAPFLVTSEVTRRSDTAQFAHVRLPALAWGEKDGTVTNSERVISRQRAFLPAPGEARPDWWIVAQVARRLGAAGFDWTGPAAIFREHAAVTGLARPSARAFDISGLAAIDDAAYAALPPTRWPVPAAGRAPGRFFAGGGTLAPRARLVPTPFRAPAEDVAPEYPLRLLTGRLRDQWHTMTRTGAVPRLMAHAPEPTLTLHPDDAAGLAPGMLVRATSVRAARCSGLLSTTGSAAARPSRRCTGPRSLRRRRASMRWSRRMPIRSASSLSSRTPRSASRPSRRGGMPSCWHRRGCRRRSRRFCAAIPLDGGAWRHELAGTDAPDAAFARLRRLVAADGAAWQVLEDAAAGLFRAAALGDGRLLGAVLLGPDAALPPRAWLAALMAGDGPLTPRERAALLAGALPGGAPPSPLVCACHGVTAATILGCGARDVPAVGAATRAGTGCGSCRPEVAALLATLPQEA